MGEESEFAGSSFRRANDNLTNHFVTDKSLPGLLAEIAASARDYNTPFEQGTIGASRGGRNLPGLRIGNGPRHVSITAGAHSDEPVGPITAIQLSSWLVSDAKEARRLTNQFTFFICPQINPDGAALNAYWFADPLDPVAYFNQVVRELPGDDVEFGYPGKGKAALRPENTGVAQFLQSGGPFIYHASLHGMAFAEGAWFLICKEWADRSSALQQTLIRLSDSHGFPLHDIDRGGDKGFTRIGPGFCTTPTSTAMQSYFMERDDATTASQFRLSSMEFIQSLGGDPLLMVSELPLFMITDPDPRPHGQPPQPGATAYEKFRQALPAVRVSAERGNYQPARDLMQKFNLLSVPVKSQVTLQGQMVLAALAFLNS